MEFAQLTGKKSPGGQGNWGRSPRGLIVSLALLLAGACSPAPAPVSTSSTDPSNPAAAEGQDPARVQSAARQPIPAHEGHASHGPHAHAHGPAMAANTQDASPQAGNYVCPMHPEVTSDSPGVCPKCNMKLVPKK